MAEEILSITNFSPRSRKSFSSILTERSFVTTLVAHDEFIPIAAPSYKINKIKQSFKCRNLSTDSFTQSRFNLSTVFSKFPSNNYITPSSELLEALNCRFGVDININRIALIAKLFAGAVVDDGCQHRILMLTNEIYYRDMAVDSHAEKNADTLPSSSMSLFITTKIIGFGGESRPALRVGSSRWNILCTLSSLITQPAPHLICSKGLINSGPFIRNFLITKEEDATIYFKISAVESFLAAWNSDTIEWKINDGHFRQLSSGSSLSSFFHPWRYSLQGFDIEGVEPYNASTIRSSTKATSLSTYLPSKAFALFGQMFHRSINLSSLKKIAEDSINAINMTTKLSDHLSKNLIIPNL